MAKAGDTISTSDWIWLREALKLTVEVIGSVARAKELLVEWLAAGKLPWKCMSLKELDEIWGWRLHVRAAWGVLDPQIAFFEGDPRFWSANLNIDWEDNAAREMTRRTDGVHAWGIKVPLTSLLALLPEEPRERVEDLRQTSPAERQSLEPKVWLAEIRKKHPRRRTERPGAYASRLHALMQTANVTKGWSFGTLLRRLYDK